MKMGNRAAQASVLALGLMLSACGGGGGVASTPTPTPTPAPTYTTLANLTGDRTFQTGGVHWNAASGGISNQGSDAFGAGVSIAYSAASGNYTVNAPGGITGSFTPADLNAQQSVNGAQVYIRNTANGQQILRLVPVSVGGVTLSYALLGLFLDGTPALTRSWIGVGGVPTIASDVPRTGSANYTAETGMTVLSGGVQYNSGANATATFSANFGAGTVATSVNVIAAPASGGASQNFGTFSGTGTIAANGPGFSGTFAGTTGAGFSGAFFGPQAREMAYTYNFISGSNEVFGSAFGVKQ